MENFEFKSDVCTTKEQSEKLLALGLKKGTADCRHWAYIKDSKGNPIPRRNQKWFTRIGTDESAQVCGFMVAAFIPAWSLHRLMLIANANDTAFLNIENMYETLIKMIASNIKWGFINKDYLEEKK